MPATKENALDIAAALKATDDHLIKARGYLAAAVLLAKEDYDGNADKLEDMLGGLRCLMGLIMPETFTWEDYARHRSE